MSSAMSPAARPTSERFAFVASPNAEAQEALDTARCPLRQRPARAADVIVALGGDGLMLQTLHRFMHTGKPIYGMHRGTVGFLMNEYSSGRSAGTPGQGAGHRDPSAAHARP